jgi:hypothetical protein
MGAIPWTAEVAGSSIPASGSVVLSNNRTPIITALNAQYPTQISADPMVLGAWGAGGSATGFTNGCTVSIDGVRGTVTESGGVFSFNRTTAGSAVSVTNPVSIKAEEMGGPAGTSYSLNELNSYTAIIWPYGTHISGNIVVDGVNVTSQITAQAEMDVWDAMIAKLGSLAKRYIFLGDHLLYPPPATSSASTFPLFETKYPQIFSHTPAFANGIPSLGIPSFKSWLLTNYPTIYNSATEGWQAELNTLSGVPITPQETKAVATITLVNNGGSGVASATSVNTTCDQKVGANDRVRLRVGVTASGGVATALWVREGGIGYELGDTIRIPVGAVGNTQAITGTVATRRTETMGTVRDAAGAVVVASSYSEWDVANGFLPRCCRRDIPHFNVVGGEYLSLLLAARINSLGW